MDRTPSRTTESQQLHKYIIISCVTNEERREKSACASYRLRNALNDLGCRCCTFIVDICVSFVLKQNKKRNNVVSSSYRLHSTDIFSSDVTISELIIYYFHFLWSVSALALAILTYEKIKKISYSIALKHVIKI